MELSWGPIVLKKLAATFEKLLKKKVKLFF